MMSFVGHDVKRINHIGDWGTQFGMLLTFMKKNHPDFLENPPSISDLDVSFGCCLFLFVLVVVLAKDSHA